MKILSIETSCDDTCVTIFEAKGGIQDASFKILANNTNSQINIHIPYGGVYPMLAKREHARNLPILLEQSLKNAGLVKVVRQGLKSPVDLIAVTYGPGLEMCLWEGIIFAKDLAEKWRVPLIPVNHMEGHVLSVFGKGKGKLKGEKLKLPALALLVSGGHTQLVLMKKWMRYEIIGETLDDAVGEAFDKVARMLGLPYPGGPEISKLAEQERKRLAPLLNKEGVGGGNSRKSPPRPSGTPPSKGGEDIFLPRPMLHSKNFNFSFSGLKTAVLYLIRDLDKKHSNILQNDKIKQTIALEFENAAIECLVRKTSKAIEKYNVNTLFVAGGVAANQHLRNQMKLLTGKKIKLLFPEPGLSTDNSVMIGIAGYLNYIKNKKKVPKLAGIKAAGNLRF